MVTCDKPAPEDSQTGDGIATAEQPETRGFPWPAVLGVGGVCVLGILIWFILAKRRKRDEDEK